MNGIRGRLLFEDKLISVRVLGETVFEMKLSGEYNVVRDGLWIAALVGIRFTLDERFGPITGDVPQHVVQ